MNKKMIGIITLFCAGVVALGVGFYLQKGNKSLIDEPKNETAILLEEDFNYSILSKDIAQEVGIFEWVQEKKFTKGIANKVLENKTYILISMGDRADYPKDKDVFIALGDIFIENNKLYIDYEEHISDYEEGRKISKTDQEPYMIIEVPGVIPEELITSGEEATAKAKERKNLTQTIPPVIELNTVSDGQTEEAVSKEP